MNGKLLLILYVFLLNVKLSKQDECSYGGYSMDEPTEEKCLSFSYQFNNSICYYKVEGDKNIVIVLLKLNLKLYLMVNIL